MDTCTVVCTVNEAHKFLGETGGFWVQTGVLFISAVAALLLIRSGSVTERLRATMDLVITQKQDTALQKSRSHVLQLHEENTQNFAKFLENRKSEDFKEILNVINNHEFIAGGIRQKALDEEMYKRMQYSVVMRDWEAFRGFITEFRRAKGISTLYQDFEWLACRWKNSKLKADSQ